MTFYTVRLIMIEYDEVVLYKTSFLTVNSF